MTIEAGAGADLVATGATADRDAAPCHVQFERDVKSNPQRVIDVGSEDLHTKRTIYSLLDTHVSCSRLLAGFTIGTPGAWTSWPPHEHNDSKEEFYLFFDMPDPAFSVQFVYPSPDKMEFAPVVRDGDCVTIPSGYHPTAAAPGHSTVFFWAMAAYDPDKHRDLKYGITIQPEYQTIKFL
jgi:5-deoxy-glucuronate isomerase